MFFSDSIAMYMCKFGAYLLVKLELINIEIQAEPTNVKTSDNWNQF